MHASKPTYIRLDKQTGRTGKDRSQDRTRHADFHRCYTCTQRLYPPKYMSVCRGVHSTTPPLRPSLLDLEPLVLKPEAHNCHKDK